MIQFHHKMGEASSEPANVITKPHWYVFVGSIHDPNFPSFLPTGDASDQGSLLNQSQ